ncbi:serine threonine- kinase Warts [Brachionus plicatilis]|uniref:Serine threonine-kinase Warts n=1 Tax=Brachionus plicatilis TaxID=10195 RepID=A0A3M7SGR3_BRAPC|nr:serine threonine- kinase Warts [Brachionus plicatilis]
MEEFNRSSSTLSTKVSQNNSEMYSFYPQNGYQFATQSLQPPPLPPPPPPPSQPNLNYFTYQSSPQPLVYQYSNYQNVSFLNSSLNSSGTFYQTTNSYVPNYQNYYPYPSSPSKSTAPPVQKADDQMAVENANTSMKRSSAALPVPKYLRPKICKSPLVIQSVQSKKVVKPKAQQAIVPPESARRVAEQLPEYGKKRLQPPPPPPPSYESSMGKKLPPPANLPPPPPNAPPQIFHSKQHKNLLNQVLENSFNSEKGNNSRNFEFEGSFNSSANNNSVFNHTGVQDENMPNYQFFIQSNLYTFFDRKKQPPPPPYPGKIEDTELQNTLPMVPAAPPVPYEQAVKDLEEQRLKNATMSSNSSNASTFSAIRQCSPQAFKFFMEQHAENVLKHHKAREYRRLQLENEMQKVGLSKYVCVEH